MCGIAGFVNARGEAEGAVLQAMLRRIAHRGPDGQGVFLEGRAALGHRRLAIIDLEGGPQPMFNEDGRFVVVFNGEIYNYQSLTEELTAAGHTFATRSDTEVLLHGWEQWGQDLLPRLRGMFAFALWTARPKRCSVPGTPSASSRCTTMWRATAPCCLPARSRLSSTTRPLRSVSTRASWNCI